MSDAFTGEIRAFGYTFAPLDWADCNGVGVPVQQSTALYAVIGNAYGGNQTIFNLPDLQARVPVGTGLATSGGTVTHALGEKGGTLAETIDANKMANHTHALYRVTNPTGTPSNAPSAQANPGGRVVDSTGQYKAMVANATPDTTFHPSTLSAVGGGHAHDNRQPYQGVRFCICVNGFFPVRN